MTYNPFTWIKAFFAVRKGVEGIKEAKMKSGAQTTEFWLTLVSIVGTVYGAVKDFIPPEFALKIVGVLVIAYTIARSLVKVAEIVVKLTKTNADDKVVDGIKMVLDKIDSTFNGGKQIPPPNAAA